VGRPNNCEIVARAVNCTATLAAGVQPHLRVPGHSWEVARGLFVAGSFAKNLGGDDFSDFRLALLEFGTDAEEAQCLSRFPTTYPISDFEFGAEFLGSLYDSGDQPALKVCRQGPLHKPIAAQAYRENFG
jgi:hypothetical protein